MSTDAEKRRNDLQTGNLRELKMQTTQVTHMRTAERAAQRAVSGYTVQQESDTEWFHVPKEKSSDFKQKFHNAIQPHEK